MIPPPFAVAITAAVIATVFGAMLLLERRRPLRPALEPKPRRIARNLTVGATALAASMLLQLPLLVPLSQWALDRRIGLLQMIDLPTAAHGIVAIVLLDYTLWIWHWANHRIPFLWRFHLVHHVDRDLDSSTALRFHFGEQALSVFYRSAQIVLIGASPFAVWLWQLTLFASILFHHSNVELPPDLERRLVRFIVTPRMHGIHHSDYLNEANSNWSSLLSWWDYLHRTILLSVPQRDVVIGVPAFHASGEVTIGKILLMPFRRQRQDWVAGGTVRVREHGADATSLAV